MPNLNAAFKASGGKVKAKGRQTGGLKSNTGKQEVADSIVELSFIDGSNNEILNISLADSTKLSQHAMQNQRLMITSTKTQSNTYTVKYLLNSIDKQLSSQFYLDYWQKRLQPYLDKAGEKNIDKNN